METDDEEQREGPNLLIRRGLDLLPSMRTPRRVLGRSPPPPALAPALEETGGGGGGGVGAAVEYVPWVGGNASVDGMRSDGVVASGGGRGGLNGGIGDWVQWFPRGLPLEVAPPEGGQVIAAAGAPPPPPEEAPPFFF